jgi:uncharacterized protein
LPSRRKRKVVIDTGVLVSAFAFGGLPRKALNQIIPSAESYISRELLEEYREVPGTLLAEGKITPLQWQALVVGIASVVTAAKVVFPRKEVVVCRDPKDDMVLTCCLAARADILLTGDKDLLTIDYAALFRIGLGRLHVFTPRAYLASLS